MPFIIDEYQNKTSEWYNKDTGEIKCCFCENSYKLKDDIKPSEYGQYICDSCDEKMREKYQYGWWSFEEINTCNEIDLSLIHISEPTRPLF